MNHPAKTQKIPIYIALGSNLGDRAANLQSALGYMAPEVIVVAESPVYQTAPWGYDDQPDFLNQVILAETRHSPAALLAFLKEIETRVGRIPTFRNGPRCLDLDILFYGDLKLKRLGLEIPHPRLAERAFVLVPLNDLSPDFRHPVTGQSVHEMLSNLDISGIKPFRP